MTLLVLAMDRAPSARRTDADGRLHVAVSNISKANVCPYMGREIPGWQEMGLDGDRVYRLLRHPDELAKALPTFNNLPVLSEHVPVTAMGQDSHMPELVVGSTGTDAAMTGGFVTNSLVVWAKPSIDGIVNEEKRQLSSAYRYRADMTPGNFNGIAFDGVMRDIVGNHVALVFQGRAGPDVIVGDEQPMKFKSIRAAMLAGGLGGLIRPLLAQDAKFDLSPALADVTATTLAMDGAPQALADKVFGLAQPYLAADSVLTVEAVRSVVEGVGGLALDGDDEIMDAPVALDVKKDPAPAAKSEKDEDDKKKDPPAMDAATVQQMVDKARTDAAADFQAIRKAERDVAPVVGELVAMDSAAAVYAEGLKALGVALDGLPESAYAATFNATKAARDALVPTIAQDGARVTAKASADFNSRYAKRATLIRG